MSHAPERKENNCLNCGATVIGRYCHVCGQENIVPKEGFGNLVIHFFYDITHFDGKFFPTLKYLIFRPGFLSKEYISGRRASYLNPVRMYVFTSAIFFLVFFMLMSSENIVKTDRDQPYTHKRRVKLIEQLKEDLKDDPNDTVVRKKLALAEDTLHTLTPGDLDKLEGTHVFWKRGGVNYRTWGEYDSAQSALASSQRDSWFERMLTRKQIQLNQKFSDDPIKGLSEMGRVLLHDLPYLLFVSLPLFALILKLLYVRRTQFYYADHVIFTIHHYIFSFILLLIVFLLGALRTNQGWQWLRIPEVILVIAWPVYLFIAMKKFYRQGGFKTFVKFSMVNILGLFLLIILFAIFFFLSIFQL